jgi:hypothetical protein
VARPKGNQCQNGIPDRGNGNPRGGSEEAGWHETLVVGKHCQPAVIPLHPARIPDAARWLRRGLRDVRDRIARRRHRWRDVGFTGKVGGDHRTMVRSVISLRPQLETSGNTVPALVIAAIGPSIDCIHPGKYRLRSTNHTNSHNVLAHTQSCTRSVSRSSRLLKNLLAATRMDRIRQPI